MNPSSESGFGGPDSPLSPSRTLTRGRACISCRRRKMRCDGARPFCNQCALTQRPQDCEYTDTQGRTRAEVLEERISQLQARIHELEHPEQASEPILLHRPYNLSITTSSRHTGDSSSAAPEEGSQALSAVSSGSQVSLSDLNPENAQALLDVSLSRATQLGFCLSPQRFRAALGRPTTDRNRPHAALVNFLYLWSLSLGRSEDLPALEPGYLNRVLSALPDAIAGPEPHRRLQAVQTEVLLALYFFSSGRLLEGRYHANAAMSLAVTCRLHQIGFRNPNTAGSSLASLTSALDANQGFRARDGAEEGEMIRMFWTVFIMDRCWSVALGCSSILYDDYSMATQIHTPWPLEDEAYEMPTYRPANSEGRTLQVFFARQARPTNPNVRHSFLAMHAQAAALFERATNMAGNVNEANLRDQTFLTSFQNLRSTIQHFVEYIPPLDILRSPNLAPSQRQRFIIIYSLAHVSMIQLHFQVSETDQRSYTTCLTSARNALKIVRLISREDLDHLDFTIGVTWLAVSQVLIREVKRIVARTGGGAGASSGSTSSSDLGRIRAELDEVVAFLGRLGANCPLMASQADTVRAMRDEVYATISRPSQ